MNINWPWTKNYNEVEIRIEDILNGCNALLDKGLLKLTEHDWDIYKKDKEILSNVLKNYSGKYNVKFAKGLIDLREHEQHLLGYHLTEA